MLIILALECNDYCASNATHLDSFVIVVVLAIGKVPTISSNNKFVAERIQAKEKLPDSVFHCSAAYAGGAEVSSDVTPTFLGTYV